MKQYDVIINGAGMVGAVAALLLAEKNKSPGFSIAVIETQKKADFSPTDAHQLRVSAISKHNLVMFERLGLTELWQDDRVGYYRNMTVWDNQSTGQIDFNSSGGQVLGAMVENNQIIATAQTVLDSHAQVDLFYETAITSFEQTDRKVKLELKDGSSMQCLMLVGADGARSQTRTGLGIQTQEKPYNQRGLVAYLSIENAPDQTALQAFNTGGPVGLLPMNGGFFSMVWSLPETEVEHWLNADEAYFINGLKAHINRDFGEIQLCSERQAFPLVKTHAKSFYKGRVVLVGDAAHTIHPLAGQGVNLGFGDAECLQDKISAIALKDADEVANALKKYQRVRMAEVRKTAETMHALHHLFTSQSAPIKQLRAFGMNRLNHFTPIKSWLLRQAGS